MSVVRSLRSAALSSLFLSLSVGICFAAGEQQVGVTSAVNPDVTGARPGATAKTLVLGENVIFNEHIQTAAKGQTQLLFLDASAMTIGPNSDLTIDKFVYDPDSGAGGMSVSAAKGVLRFVGGKLSKQDNGVELKTPDATIAIRGGAFLMALQPGGRLDIFFIYGKAVTVTGTNGVSQTVSRPGFAITVSAPGASPSAPYPAPPGAIDAVLVQVDGRPGGNGGAAQVPTDLTVTSSGISGTISGDLATSIQSAEQNLAPNSLLTVNSNTAGNTVSSLVSTNVTPPIVPVDCAVMPCPGVSRQTFFTPTLTTPPPSPPPPPPSNVVINFAGNFRSTNGQGTARGFVDPNGVVSYAGGTLTFPPGMPQQGLFTATLQTSQGPITVSFPLVPGNATINPLQTQSPLGPVGGTTFLSADRSFFYANLQPINSPTEKEFIFGGTAVLPSVVPSQVAAYTVQPDAALQSAIPFIRNNAGGAIPNATVSPLYVVTPASASLASAASSGAGHTLQASLAINGNGPNQQSAIGVNFGTLSTPPGSSAVGINGVVRGSSMLSASGTPTSIQSTANSVVDGNGNSLYGTNAITGFALASTGATETPLNGAPTTYGFAQPATATALPSGVGTSRTTQTQTGFFGGTVNSTATSPYTIAGTTSVTTNASTNGVAATFSGSPVSGGGYRNLTMQFGGPGAPQAFVDDKNFGAAESVSTNSQVVTLNGSTINATGPLYMVTSGTAPAPQSLLPSGASYCACQYLQWGYWGGSLSTANGTTPRVDQPNINFWVAGQPTPATDIASLQAASLSNAQASYTGHAIGSVANNGQQYVAAGGFNGSYNFASQQMNLSVTNFDGHNFNGSTPISSKTPVTLTSTGNSYALPVNNTGGFTGAFNGSFYGPQAANTGGNFAVQSTVGPSYIASGIYAGHR